MPTPEQPLALDFPPLSGDDLKSLLGQLDVPEIRLAAPNDGGSHQDKQRQLPQRRWAGTVRQLFPENKPTGAWRVFGSAGTGKTSLLVDLAVEHMRAGRPARQIQLLTHSKESASRVRNELAQRLAQADVAGSITATAGSMVRGIHSMAFAVVRNFELQRSGEPPALTTGAQQDVVVRTLLAGHAEQNGAYWPAHLVPALSMPAFARNVRDVMLRCAERGVSGEQLQEFGVKYHREEWVAIGKFIVEYQQTMRLTGVESLNASELVTKAAGLVRSHPELVSELGISLLLIDDAQHVDPQAGAFLKALAEAAELTVITADVDQMVLRFRGASTGFLEQIADGEHTIELHTSFRATSEIMSAYQALGRLLPGSQQRRQVRSFDGSGAVEDAAVEDTAVEGAAQSVQHGCQVLVHPTRPSEYASVADFLRRRHIEAGVPWSDMAVIVRSGAKESALTRYLSQVGVPIEIDPSDMVLREERLVAGLMLALSAVINQDPLVAYGATAETAMRSSSWQEFLLGSFGKADPVTFDRLIRAVRRLELKDPERFPPTGGQAFDRIIELLENSDQVEDSELLASLPQRERQILQQPLQVLIAGRQSLSEGVEATLWAVWEASGLAEHLVAMSLRGGVDGAMADRDLDAVLALFDFAGDLVEDDPQLTVAGFIDAVASQELAMGRRDRRSVPREAVRILSAHSSLGNEYDTVAVTGVQDGQWPDIGLTGSLLHQDQLVEFLDNGITPGQPISYLSQRLADERRLLSVAISRAKRAVIVTAVDSPADDCEPSVFIRELAAAGVPAREIFLGEDPAEAEITEESDFTPAEGPRVLSQPTLIAELRHTATNENATPVHRKQAAWQLARLARAGILAARPDQWWHVRGISEWHEEPKISEEIPARFSPSSVEKALKCPVEYVMNQDDKGEQLTLGSLFHTIAEFVPTQLSVEEAEDLFAHALRQIYREQPESYVNAEIAEWIEALGKWESWATQTKVSVSEMPFDVTVPSAPPVQLRGRVDAIVFDSDGGLHVVDIKTGKTLPSEKKTSEHSQLASYQIALNHLDRSKLPAHLEFPNGEPDLDEPLASGARLVYPRAEGLSMGVRYQAELTQENSELWLDNIGSAAAQIARPQIPLRPHDECSFCVFNLACPATEENNG